MSNNSFVVVRDQIIFFQLEVVYIQKLVLCISFKWHCYYAYCKPVLPLNWW